MYTRKFHSLQQLTSPKKSTIYECPSGKGIEVSSLIKRPSQSYAEHISTSVSDNPDVQRALLELFATPTEWKTWVHDYIPKHPEFIDILISDRRSSYNEWFLFFIWLGNIRKQRDPGGYRTRLSRRTQSLQSTLAIFTAFIF